MEMIWRCGMMFRVTRFRVELRLRRLLWRWQMRNKPLDIHGMCSRAREAGEAIAKIAPLVDHRIRIAVVFAQATIVETDNGFFECVACGWFHNHEDESIGCCAALHVIECQLLRGNFNQVARRIAQLPDGRQVLRECRQVLREYQHVLEEGRMLIESIRVPKWPES